MSNMMFRFSIGILFLFMVFNFSNVFIDVLAPGKNITGLFGSDIESTDYLLESIPLEINNVSPKEAIIEVGATYYSRGHFIANIIDNTESDESSVSEVCEVEVNRLLHVKSYLPGVGAEVIHMVQTDYLLYEPILISNAPVDCADKQSIFVKEFHLEGMTPYSEIVALNK